MPQVGIVGKPNTGKSTFFSALTMVSAKIAPYPFTTIEPNKGIGYIRVNCVCKELNIKDDPVNSKCINGVRFVPVEVLDVAGLVPDAWSGRGLGNKFLDELRRADALIHVVDASGGTDEEGRPVKPGSHDPLKDVRFVEREFAMWIFKKLESTWKRDVKAVEHSGLIDNVEFFSIRLSGYALSKRSISEALENLNLKSKPIKRWELKDLERFISEVIRLGKPILIAANKADLPESWDNIKRMKEELEDYIIIPTSAISELALRKASEKGLIKYNPGDKDFEIIGELSKKQLKALEYIRENVLKRYGSTGVQETLEAAYFKLLNMIAVFPVEDVSKYSDHHGRVLPDVYLIPRGTTAREFAYKIHTELGEGFLYAIDARTKKRLSENYELAHRDIIKIISVKARKS